MNREIEFRAFDDGRMIYHSNLDVDIMDQLSWFFNVIRRDAIIMQFIGVRGQKDVKIFSGDKVKGRYMVQKSLNPDAEPKIIHFEGVINYADGCHYVKSANGQCVFSFNYPDYEIEVIVLRLCVCLPLAQSFKLLQMFMGQIAQNRCYTLARIINNKIKIE